jgi:hypothetical protein
VTDNRDQLRNAFETHENLAPDPGEVYARVQDLAKGYKWRRRGVQAAGGAVLGAGLIAGGIALHGVLPGSGSDVTVVAPAAAPSADIPTPTPSATPKPTAAELKLWKQWDAYFGAGYSYDEAVKLKKIWKMKGDIGTVKAAAGQKLLDGKKLPVKPGTAVEHNGFPSAKEEAQVDAFFAAGYNYDDAAALAKLWKQADPYKAKVLGGKKLLAGETLPIKP